MTAVDGTFTCVPGEMTLSPTMQISLTDYVELPPDHGLAVPFTWGTDWFCPLDGTKMTEFDGHVECPACNHELSRGILFDLLDEHPHQPTSASSA